MSSPPTAEQVKQLATGYGETVLVPCADMPDQHWVIGTGNRHYQGADTVVATGDQVCDLAAEYDGDAWNSNGEMTDEAAEEIAAELDAQGPGAALVSARAMRNPGGHPDAPTEGQRPPTLTQHLTQPAPQPPVGCARCAPSAPWDGLPAHCPDGQPHTPYSPGLNIRQMPQRVQEYARTHRPEMFITTPGGAV